MTPALTTTMLGVDKRSGRLWLDMLRAMSADMNTVGVVASDMLVPGIPLSEINDGFRAVTGYGSEMVGQNCKFLQGDATEDYLVEEIVDALRSSESLVVKLTNHKRDGTVFQCLLTLKPIFDAAGTYAYSLGAQLDMTDGAPDEDRVAQLRALSDVGRYLPEGMSGQRYLTAPDREVAEPVKAVKPKPRKPPPSYAGDDGEPVRSPRRPQAAQAYSSDDDEPAPAWLGRTRSAVRRRPPPTRRGGLRRSGSVRSVAPRLESSSRRAPRPRHALESGDEKKPRSSFT